MGRRRLSIGGRGLGFEAVGGELRVLVSYAVVMFTAGLILFDFVWME